MRAGPGSSEALWYNPLAVPLVVLCVLLCAKWAYEFCDESKRRSRVATGVEDGALGRSSMRRCCASWAYLLAFRREDDFAATWLGQLLHFVVRLAATRQQSARPALAGTSRLNALPEVPGAPRRTDRHSPPTRRRGKIPHPEPGPQPRLQRLPNHQPGLEAASTASPFAASTWATTLANVPISAPTRSAPASTSKPSWPPCGTRRRRNCAAARPPSRIRKSTCNYGEQLRVGLHLPPRHSDRCTRWPDAFDPQWPVESRRSLSELIEVVQVPEQVTIFSDAMEFMDARSNAKRWPCASTNGWHGSSADRADGVLLDLLKVPL